MELPHVPDSVMGVDGCRGGWIVAYGNSAQVTLYRINHIELLWTHFPAVRYVLIDMIMGLPTRKGERTIDQQVASYLGSRRSSLFRVPSRGAVTAITKAEQYRQHEHQLGEKLTPFSIHLIPKIRELDEVLHHHREWQLHTYESHPETCFRLLKGDSLNASKKTPEGIDERIEILSPWIPHLSHTFIKVESKRLQCAKDDVVDALVLYVTGLLATQQKNLTLLNDPLTDDHGIMMRIMLPDPQ